MERIIFRNKESRVGERDINRQREGKIELNKVIFIKVTNTETQKNIENKDDREEEFMVKKIKKKQKGRKEIKREMQSIDKEL